MSYNKADAGTMGHKLIKFELVWLMIFLQAGFLVTGMVSLTPTTTLLAPYVDVSFGGGITTVANSVDVFVNSIRALDLNNLMASQPWQLCIPISNFCAGKIMLPGINILGIVVSPFVAIWGIFQVFVLIILQATVFAGFFYAMILMTLLPNTPTAVVFANGIGIVLGVIQTCIILWEVLTSVRIGGSGLNVESPAQSGNSSVDVSYKL
jgi:hypothetical protein